MLANKQHDTGAHHRQAPRRGTFGHHRTQQASRDIVDRITMARSDPGGCALVMAHPALGATQRGLERDAGSKCPVFLAFLAILA